MQHIAVIARWSLIAVVWFGALLGCAALSTLLLAAPYELAGLAPLARTLITMSLAIVAATTIAVLSWHALSRHLSSAPRTVEAEVDAKDAAFVGVG